MKTTLLHVALRQGALFIPETVSGRAQPKMEETTSVLVANATKLGFGFSEEVLHQLNGTSPTYKLTILETLKEVKGVDKNWTPLVKGWDQPTGETRLDHVFTFFAQLFRSRKGTTLPCGHVIPDGTFPLERYNGCPYCGTPFEFGQLESNVPTGKLTLLEWWNETHAANYLTDLLKSKTALDATQVDNLKVLLDHFPIPENVSIEMKETAMLVIDAHLKKDEIDKAGSFFKTPNDILRYLWYKHTGFLQLIEPKTILKRQAKNSAHISPVQHDSAAALLQAKAQLKLKYSRKECRTVALWLNTLADQPEKACEIMHSKRGMWVRFIRALRLAEYGKRKGFEPLANLLDVFYNQKYTVWEGEVSQSRLKLDSDRAFMLLKQRPGLFARSLFANILWFGADETLNHFSKVATKVPARLLFTLNSYKDLYFDRNGHRSVKPLGGNQKRIPTHPLLKMYNQHQLDRIKDKIDALVAETMKKRFAAQTSTAQTIYIEPNLYRMPVAIGDRSETVQDLPSALMGTRFPIEGEKIRLFMQWGKGLPAQHLDMDLSCMVAYDYHTQFCSYAQLLIPGCKHSGDIQHIPDQIGTAEYIEIDLAVLRAKGARYASFTCNAYSNGSLTPNLTVGWMDSQYPLSISKHTGVAYHPAHVQHQVRVEQGTAKGLVFGVIDIRANEIIWLEMPFGGQLVQGLDTRGVEALIAKLDSKLNIGYLLELKAEAQQLTLTTNPDGADEVYDLKWAGNPAQVTQLLID